MKQKKFDISIIIVTYKPIWNKLKATLVSCLRQRNINFEIIVSDDGSNEYYSQDIKEVFQQYEFSDYKILHSPKNRGTTLNLINGVNFANGKYIKSISPGDCLYCDTSLAEWFDFVEKNDISVSFGKAIFYYIQNHNIHLIKHLTCPKQLYLYRNSSEKYNRCRKEYLYMDDMALGAAFLVKKDILLKYLHIIENKVILGEDFAFTIMVYDNIKLFFYNKNVVFYEFGTGVSTSNNSHLSNIMSQDLLNVRKIILNMKPKSNFDIRYRKYLAKSIAYSNRKFWRYYKYIFRPEIFYWWLLSKIHREYTGVDIDNNSFVNLIVP